MNARQITRRSLLRGFVGGTVVAIGLPALERFLTSNGDAYADAAADGFPKRFGLFFWGNGMLPDQWTPQAKGKDWTPSPLLQPLAPWQDKLTVVTGTRLYTANTQPHTAGTAGLLSGQPLLHQGGNVTFAGPTIDQLLAERIGNETRFRSLEFGASPGGGQSYNGPNSQNPAESSPIALYQRLFGLGFVMPGETPKFDPTLGLRRSALDGVTADLKSLQTQLGAADKQRLEQHTEGIRQLEKRLAKLQEAPPKLAACKVPAPPLAAYPDVEGRPQLQEKNKAFCDLVAYAMACDQVRVFGNYFTAPVNNLLFSKATSGHHQLTHDEGGAQPEVAAITLQCIQALAYQIEVLAKIQEGATTLLDHCAVLGTSEVSLGRTHSLEEMPIIIAGSAGGKLKTGLHYRSDGGENTSKVMLSISRAVAGDVPTFGAKDGLAKEGLGGIEA